MPGEVLREIFVLLGVKSEDKDFTKALLKVEALKVAAHVAVEALKAIGEALVEAFVETGKEAEALLNLSKRTQVSVQSLQVWRAVAEDMGLEAGSITLGLRTLATQMQAAADGSSEAQQAFARLGVKVTGADGKLRPLEEVLGQIADKFAAMPDGAAKIALARQVLGRAGDELIPVLSKGSAGLDELKRKLIETGRIMSDDMVRDAAEFDDSMDDLHNSFRGLQNAIVGPLLVPLTEVVKVFKDWIIANREIIATRVVGFVKAVGAAFGVVFRLAKPFLEIAFKLATSATFLKVALGVLAAVLVAGLAAAIGTAVLAIPPLIAALFALTAAEVVAAALPLAIGAAFLALVAILALVTEDLVTFFQGGKSQFGALLAVILKAKDAIVFALKDMFELVTATWRTSITEFITWLGAKLDLLPAPVKAALIGAVASPIAGAVQGVKDANTVGNALVSGWQSFDAWSANLLGVGGGGAGPQSFKANIVINQQPGQDADDVAGATTRKFSEWYREEIGKARPALTGGTRPPGEG